ncbi:MAG: 30S ribosomal protein S19 [archaeon]|jgi:small subunit ribosomal protein S19
MAEEFKFRGHTLEQLQKMSLLEFANIAGSRAKRHLARNHSDIFYEDIEKNVNPTKKIRTHKRDMVVTPKMIGKTIYVYNGKEFIQVDIVPDMLAHYLGEFAFTRRRIRHGKAGIGATKSSTAVAARK